MKTLLIEAKTALVLTLVFAVLLCGAYPAVVWLGAHLLFPRQAEGSLIVDSDGTLRGSSLLGQNFTSERYFNSRPSAAGSGYDAANSSGTNLGPTSQKLRDAIKAATDAYRVSNNLAPETPVPAEAVTSSASGLDPHISPANAVLQSERVARVRKLPLAAVVALVESHTNGRQLVLLGEPCVNVLELNLALDHLSK